MTNNVFIKEEHIVSSASKDRITFISVAVDVFN